MNDFPLDTSNEMIKENPESKSTKSSDTNKDSQNRYADTVSDQYPQPVPFFRLFRFATRTDHILMLVGTIASLLSGAAMPVFSLLWGDMTDSFGKGGNEMVDAAKRIMFIFFGIGAATFVAGWLMFACWMISGQRQAIACRKAYLASLLRQEIGWFDMINQSELASKFSTDSFSYQSALGEKNSTLLMTLGMFIAGFGVAFSIGWLMTLVVLTSLPAIGFTGYLFMWGVEQKDMKSANDYSKAGGLAEQALSSIKTIKMLNGEDFESVNYEKCLKEVTKKSIKYSAIAGLGMGGLFGTMLLSYALGFWFGSHCVEGTDVCMRSNYTAGDVIIVFFSILMAGFNLSQLTPALKKIAQGRQAAARIFKIVDRQPFIKNPENAKRPSPFKGLFKFQNVFFSYPKDPNRLILNNLSLQFDSNSSALVGESGCGKSTVFQLLMRFYDPDQGRITLDGIDLKEIDLFWLRENIGYVGQEPVLFATTIRENLSFGKDDATEDEINVALKKAEAFDFVQTLDEKLQTYVGTGGGQLSGGQKQRIAIARALLRNPKILLLDQATSALDRKNERLIQETLDKVSEERTSITIAHRAKTIMKCDMIYVLEKGMVQESGRFGSLKRFKGVTIDKDDDLNKKNSKKGKKIQHQQLQSQRPNTIIDFTTLETNKKEQLTKEEQEKLEQEQLLKKYQKSIFKRVFSYAQGNEAMFAFAIILAIINGCIFPVFSIFLSQLLETLISFKIDPADGRRKANLYSLLFLLMGILAFIVNFLQLFIFNHIGEIITSRIRNESYRKMLKMPIPWFDIPRNNAGVLTAKLSSDCKSINGLTTSFISISIQNVATLLSSLIIAFVFEWRVSLVTLGLIPIMIGAGVVQMSLQTGFSDKTDAAYKESSSLIMQALLNIRTVSSFGYENIILKKYSQKLEQPYNLGVKKGNVSGLLYGLSQFVMFIIFALVFFLGTLFIRDNQDVSVGDTFTAIYALVFGAMTVGNNAHFLPDIASSKNAAASLFEIMDSEDEDQKQIREQSKLLKKGIKGKFQLKNISFKYQTRNTQLFENFNLTINQGKKVAFVGHSGCGKSTIFQLLLKFYEPSSGKILVDNQDIKDYDIHYLRDQIGVVSQEPVLFNGSFRYNIKYNKEGATDEQMLKAAKQARAYSFITGQQTLNAEQRQKMEKQKKQKMQKQAKIAKMTKKSSQKEDKPEQEHIEYVQTNEPDDQFSRSVGIKGSHISGGQKQRVAIARAILRDPTILFLDQATSALDSANEKIVQQSLDKIMKNRTSLSIAHRIDTIKNSDQIDVFDHGKIVEQGSYGTLVAKKGYFYNLERGTDFL